MTLPGLTAVGCSPVAAPRLGWLGGAHRATGTGFLLYGFVWRGAHYWGGASNPASSQGSPNAYPCPWPRPSAKCAFDEAGLFACAHHEQAHASLQANELTDHPSHLDSFAPPQPRSPPHRAIRHAPPPLPSAAHLSAPHLSAPPPPPLRALLRVPQRRRCSMAFLFPRAVSPSRTTASLLPHAAERL